LCRVKKRIVVTASPVVLQAGGLQENRYEMQFHDAVLQIDNVLKLMA